MLRAQCLSEKVGIYVFGCNNQDRPWVADLEGEEPLVISSQAIGVDQADTSMVDTNRQLGQRKSRGGIALIVDIYEPLPPGLGGRQNGLFTLHQRTS